MPEILGFGGFPAVLLRGIPGKALSAFPGSFWNSSGISSGKSLPYWGCGPPTGKIHAHSLVLRPELGIQYTYTYVMRAGVLCFGHFLGAPHEPRQLKP